MNYFSRFLQKRILKILEEAFELTWFVCDSYYQEFCASTLVHVMAQIIPTGFVLNTAYWPFYITSCYECVCLCNIYSIRCPHEQNYQHYLNLRERVNLVHLVKTDADRFKITEANFHIRPLEYRRKAAFKVNISFVVENLRTKERNGHSMSFRLTLRKAVNGQHWGLRLHPHPLLLKYYGKIIPTIIPENATIPTILTISSVDAPSFTIALEKPTLRMHDRINI